MLLLLLLLLFSRQCVVVVLRKPEKGKQDRTDKQIFAHTKAKTKVSLYLSLAASERKRRLILGETILQIFSNKKSVKFFYGKAKEREKKRALDEEGQRYMFLLHYKLNTKWKRGLNRKGGGKIRSPDSPETFGWIRVCHNYLYNWSQTVSYFL